MRKITTFAAMAVVAMLALAVAGPAAAKDRNHDNIPDKWEKKHNLSLKKNQARKDQDKDGAKNKAEYKARTDPRDDDTDDDGVEDGDENAGMIESFDPATGELVLKLFGGDSVSGTVDESTEIECGCRGDSGEDADEGDDIDDDSRARGDDDTDEDVDEDVDDDHSGPGHDGDEGDDDHSGSGHDGSEGSPCTVDDLIAGTAVHEAELKVTADGLVFTEIELVPDNPEADDDSGDDDGTPDQGSGDN